MSYILDALRRADAERERSEAPGLHAQHLEAALPDDGPGERSHRGRWLIGFGVVALVAALAWFFLRTPPPAAPTAPVPMAVEHPPEPPAAAAAPPAPTPLAAPTPATPVAPAVVERAAPVEVVTSLPPIPSPAAPVAAPTKAAPAPGAAAAVATVPDRPAAPASAAAPEPRIPTQAELPDDLRREIPTLVVGGAMYSPTPANRMLILNGQVTHEGDQPAPGLVLEQINLKTAVLRYKGQRFRIAY